MLVELYNTIVYFASLFKNTALSLYKKLEFWICFIAFIWVSYHFINSVFIWYNTGKWPEGFVNNKEKLINNNSFSQITLPKYTDYDIEMAIPSGQVLHNTVQGNWGLSTDSYFHGPTLGVYRDGYSADGSIYKGLSGKKYKRMLEQGPYTLKYSFRKGENNNQDVKIYVNDSLIHDLKNEGVTSDKFKVVGTNYASFNKETTNSDRGRRKIDYIKFIPMINQDEESFSNMNVYNIENFIVRENFQSTISKQMQQKNARKIENYITAIRELRLKNQMEYNNNADLHKLYEKALSDTIFGGRWRGHKYAASPAFYEMHKDINQGTAYDVIINKYKHIIHDKQLKTNGKKGKRYFNRRLSNKKVQRDILHDLGYYEEPPQPKQLEQIMYWSMARIVEDVTFVKNDSAMNEEEEETTDFQDMKKADLFKKPLYKQVTAREKESKKQLNEEEKNMGKNILPSGDIMNDNKRGFCPKGCVKPTEINGDCDKDIIRMVVDGQDKYFRQCSYRCKNRDEKDFINYDRSSATTQYNLKRDGCRYTQAHCSENCNKTLVEVDKHGRGLNNLYQLKKINADSSSAYAKKETTGIFGNKDNRLGGSKTAYRTDYKPQDPNPKYGPVNYDSIWNFKA